MKVRIEHPVTDNTFISTVTDLEVALVPSNFSFAPVVPKPTADQLAIVRLLVVLVEAGVITLQQAARVVGAPYRSIELA